MNPELRIEVAGAMADSGLFFLFAGAILGGFGYPAGLAILWLTAFGMASVAVYQVVVAQLIKWRFK